jgi:hypothetical protein
LRSLYLDLRALAFICGWISFNFQTASEWKMADWQTANLAFVLDRFEVIPLVDMD